MLAICSNGSANSTIANSNLVEFFSGSGNTLGQLDFANPLNGIGMIQIDGTPAVIVSHDERVECWKLPPNRVASRPR